MPHSIDLRNHSIIQTLFFNRNISSRELPISIVISQTNPHKMVTMNGTRGYPLYRYEPSIAAAVIFCILFLLATIIHSVQMVKTRTWFLTAFVLGGLCKL